RTVDSITFDWQDAYVTNTSGAILATIMHVCQNTQAWTNLTFSMAAFAGQTVRIEFLAHGDNAGDPTDMFVDDVSLVAPGACGTATPTATATPTSTSTATTLAATATATCPVPQNYAITNGAGAIVPGTTDIGNHCDDC